MASPTLLLAQYLGLDAYGSESAELALETLLRIRQIFPAKQSCVIGGMAAVHYVGKTNRQISPDLDLLISIGSAKLIERHFKTTANNFGVTVDCGEVSIHCLATMDAMEREVIETSHIANLAGSLVRVASMGGMMALKYMAGRAKDFDDIRLLLSVSISRPDHEQTLATARKLIQRCHESQAEDFESELLSALLAHQHSAPP